MAFTDELMAYGDRVTLVPQDEAGHPDFAGIFAETQPAAAGRERAEPADTADDRADGENRATGEDPRRMPDPRGAQPTARSCVASRVSGTPPWTECT